MMRSETAELPMPSLPWSGVITASLASSVLTLGLPITVLQVYDRVLPNQSMSTLSLLGLTLAIILVIDTFLRIFRSQLMSWTAAKYEYQLGCALTSALLHSRLDSLEKDGPGTQSRRLTAIDSLKSFYCGTAATAVFELPLVLISLLLVTFISGWLVLVPLTLSAIFLLIGWYVGTLLHAALIERSKFDDRRSNFLVELFTGIDSVKSLVLEEQMRRRYERLFDSVDPLVYKAASLTAVVRGMSDAFAQMMIVVVASAAAWQVINGDLTLGEMAACTLLCGRTLQPTLQMLGLWSQYQTTRVSQKHLAAGLSLPNYSSGELRPALTGAIQLKDISYRHAKTGKPLFTDLNFAITAGEFVGIRGGDGSGKSSFVQLITGLVAPDKGQILFDDIPINHIHLRTLRDQIGVVSERATRFNGTIMENLTLFQGEDVAVDEIELLRSLGIEEAVAKLAQGYSTQVHGGTTDASESLLQRIGIARALVNRPKFLILDEANNGLDHEGDRHFSTMLNGLRGQLTIILITQRPSLLKLADRQLVLQGGQITNLADGGARELETSGTAERPRSLPDPVSNP
ncbi:MAG: peptidase domain-containing ABC transporter [Geminicoccaceae bacterium]